MASLSLSLFGSFQARLGYREFSNFHTRKVQALLIYLAVEKSAAGNRRERLMDLLFPDITQSSAQTNLRQVVYHLRKIVRQHQAGDSDAPVEFLLSDRHTIQIHPDYPVRVDVLEFEVLVDQVWNCRHPRVHECESCLDMLQQACDLYRGDFLADFYLSDSSEFEAWAAALRETFRRKMLDALDVLSESSIQRKDYRQANIHTGRQIEIDNLRESAYRQRMIALSLSGRQAEALGVYEDFRKLIDLELGTAPSARTTALYEQITHGSLDDELTGTSVPSTVRGYTLKQEIGVGPTSNVYRGVQDLNHQEVAVKVLRVELANDPGFIRNFDAAAQAFAALDHPHIVPILDHWREPDRAYIVMPFFQSGNLASLLHARSITLPTVTKMLDQISGAIDAAHNRGLVHGNVKSSNVLFDREGNAHLSDFLLMDLAGPSPPGPDRPAMRWEASGLPHPEENGSRPPSPESDLEALGALLVETLRATGLDVSPSLQAVLQRAVSGIPEDKYASAGELADDYRAALGLHSAAVSPAGAETVPPTLHPSETAEPRPINPYKGLRAFQEEDAADFFGREGLVEKLVSRLRADRFLAVVGPSGSGKSSVVSSGLVPALRTGAVPGSERWFISRMTPGAHPIEELERALLPIAVNPPPSLVEPILKERHGLLRILRRILPDETNPQLLLIIDQFEELYTLVSNKHLRDHFIDSLVTALEDPFSPLRVVITLRADFYDRPLQSQALGRLLQWHSELVLPLSPDELERAVGNPAHQMGVELEAGLMAAISADINDQPGGLPLLQYALTELFDSRRGNVMTLDVYLQMGRLTGALGRRAEALLDALDPDSQAAARQIFLRLVTLGEGVEDTRRRVPRSELEALYENQGRLDTLEWVTDTFGRHRLLTFDRDPLTRGPTVEVAHEALLREWPRLREWLLVSRDDLRHQRRLSETAGEWIQAGRTDGFLLQGSRLDQFAEWAESTSLALTSLEKEFLERSLASRQARRDEEEARQRRELDTAHRLAETEKERAREHARDAGRLRALSGILTAALVVAAVLAILALNFGRSASENADLAATRQVEAVTSARYASARELAAAALANLSVDPERSILLALRAVEETYSVDQTVLPEAENALHQAVQASRVLKTLSGHTGPVTSLAFNPDGSLLATAGFDSILKIWDSETGLLRLSLLGHTGPVNDVAFSPDGDSLATAGSDGSVRIWDPYSGGEQFTLLSQGVPVLSLAISFDGQRLAAAYQNGLVVVWDLDRRTEHLILSGHAAPVVGVAFSPDGRWLGTASQDKTARIWDLTDGSLLHTLESHSLIVQGVGFSPDSLQLVTGSWDSTVKFWDVGSGKEVAVLTSHTNAIPDLVFSFAGALLATASLDTSAKVWDTHSGQELLTLSGHLGAVTAVAFRGDGKWLATASVDGTAKIWDITPSREYLTLYGHEGWVVRFGVSPDGKTLATASLDGSARVWDLQTGAELLVLQDFSGWVHGVVFSPDGSLLATASQDGVKLWELERGTLRHFFPGHTKELLTGTFSGVMNVAFSPDGSLLAGAGADGIGRVWDVRTGGQTFDLAGHTRGLYDIVFSPDGRLIATASEDSTAKLWDASTGGEIHTLTGHTSFLWSVAFSTDSRLLLTTSRDGTAKIWDVETFQEIATITGHSGTVFDGVFSPDMSLIATSGGDGTTRVWDAVTGLQRLVLSSHSKLVSSSEFSADGRLLISSGMDGTVRIHVLPIEELVELAESRLTRTWREGECVIFLHLERCPGSP